MNEVIEQLRRENIISEADSVSGLEHKITAVQSALQVKEDQLTQTTDKLLQVSECCVCVAVV